MPKSTEPSVDHGVRVAAMHSAGMYDHHRRHDQQKPPDAMALGQNPNSFVAKRLRRPGTSLRRKL
jgi:hypothetical protein